MTHTIHPLLAPYINEIQITNNSAQLMVPYKIYPNLFVVMGFQYQGRISVLTDDGKMSLLKNCGMTGLLKTYRVFQAATTPTVSILLKFYPWAIPALLNIPANEFTHYSLGLEDILKGKIINNLQERIQTAQNPSVAADIIQEFLVQLYLTQTGKILPQQRIVTIARQLANNPLIDSIEELASKHGYSKRSLERYFQEMVGLSPKRFLLTARFQKVLSLLQASFAWEEIAEYFGYYDQSHFIKDFKQFAGTTPHQFIQSTS